MTSTTSKDILPPWTADQCPLYDTTRSYEENLDEGPFFSGKPPTRHWPEEGLWVDFLGHKVASRVGVPAGPLLNSKWTSLAFDMGFDVVTYKTIRSQPFAGHPHPNIVFIDQPEPLCAGSLPPHVRQVDAAPSSLENLSITNSFGMPSQAPEILAQDIPAALDAVNPGQVLVVSIVGSGDTGDTLFDDFVATAALAKDCNAPVVEANFSCPNVSQGQGSLYLDAAAVEVLTSKLTAALGDIPLIIKVGAFPSAASMKETLIAATQGGASAVAGINTVKMHVVDNRGLSPLGPDRPTSGVCGTPIRHTALDFVRDARQIIDAEKLGLTIIGVGGITLPKHFDLFFDAGADFAQTATGMMWDPFLAARYHFVKDEGGRMKTEKGR